MSTGIKLSLNEIVVSALGSAMRLMLLQAVETINENFASLSAFDESERVEKIIDLLGLSHEDTVKIKKSQKKSPETATAGKKPRTAKPKEVKECPVPFWGAKTTNLTKCNALTSRLFSQCLAECVDGSVFCAKCKKDFDSNGPISKRGTINERSFQFKHMSNNSHNIYETPDGKKHKIYVKTWIEKTKGKYTIENLNSVLDKLPVQLSEEELSEMMYVPEKKTKKGKKMTDGMGKKSADDENEEGNEDDDNETVTTESTEVNDLDDEDEESLKKPEPEPELRCESPEFAVDDDDEEEVVEKIVEYKGLSESYQTILQNGKTYVALRTEYASSDHICDLYETNFLSKENRNGEKTFTVGRIVGKLNKQTKKMIFE